MQNKLEFLNRNGEKFDWENDDLAEIEVKTVEEKLVQPNFIAEIPGIPLESDYLEIQPPQISNQVPEIPAAQRTAAARKNAGRDVQMTTQITPRGVDEGDDDASVIDITGSDNESEVEDEDDQPLARGVDIKIESEPQDSGVPRPRHRITQEQ